MEKSLKLVFLLGLLWILSGCSIFHSDSTSRTQDEASIITLSNKLSDKKAQVFQDSGSLTIKLLNQDFFAKNSANFTGDAYEALDLIFGLSKYYRESSIVVTGYYNSNGDDCVAKVLATERARKVAQYLWRSKIDSSFIYADDKNITVTKNKELLSNCVLIKFAN